MKERKYPRQPVEIQTDFVYDNTRYTGTVRNISENGMYISTELPQSFNPKMHSIMFLRPKFEIYIPVNGKIIKVPLIARRFEKTDGFYNGIGAEVRKICMDYEELLRSI